jgi:hypothetical protein
MYSNYNLYLFVFDFLNNTIVLIKTNELVGITYLFNWITSNVKNVNTNLNVPVA